MLFHFGVPGFSGGFVGVDVFFVISGFLMTGIITRGLERGDFSVLSFYLARAKRILPALLVLCTFLLIAGWWILPSPEYRMLGTHSAFSLIFLANIKFWLEAGYFDAASHEKWLLHIWSLAVEWQFYLLLPLVLLLAWRLRPGRNTIVLTLLAGLLASLALSTTLTQGHPSAAFYLLPTRAWEMLAGGLICLLPKGRASWSQALEATGMSAIIASVALFDSSTPWPGWHALLPVTGTMLVLNAARTDSPWTGNTIAQWLGNCSYSLYLWHWPIVVGLSYFDLQQDAFSVSAGLLLTLAFGQASYAGIEVPARELLGRWRFAFTASSVTAVTVALVAFSASVRASSGYPGRLPTRVEIAAREAENHNPRRDACHAMSGTESPACVFGGKNIRVIVLGDSHANALTSAIADALPDRDDGIMTLSYSSCPTARNFQPAFNGPEKHCSAFNEWAWRKIREFPSEIPLIIVNHTSLYFSTQDREKNTDSEEASRFSQLMKATACDYAKDRTVYMTRPIPSMKVNIPRNLSHRLAAGLDADIFIRQADYMESTRAAWLAQDEAATRCGVRILDSTRYLCDGERCHGSGNGRPYYYDDNHLSEHGNKLLSPMFANIFATP
jgi:peptidoglycan/LPS O-acetylase OafA/YrhL